MENISAYTSSPTETKVNLKIKTRTDAVINLLEKQYPDIALNSATTDEFTGKLFDSLKRDVPKGTSHQNMAEIILSKIITTPDIKTAATRLSKTLPRS